jgi:hypothetical protein
MPLLVDYGRSVQDALDQVGAFVPKLIGALVVLLIGYIIARVVGKAVERVLATVGADRALASHPIGARVGTRPSSLVGRVVFWFIFALAILAAVGALGIQALSDAVASITGYIPNVIAAILILVVAIAIAGAVPALVQRLMGGTMLGKIVQTAVPTLVITIALFMALVQLKIATQIVVATYVLVLGAIALGFALAFGLGGRDVARMMLVSAYETGRTKMPQMRAEMRQAKEQAADQVQTVKDQPTHEGDAPTRTDLGELGFHRT